jgi:hypothetical protein
VDENSYQIVRFKRNDLECKERKHTDSVPKSDPIQPNYLIIERKIHLWPTS